MNNEIGFPVQRIDYSGHNNPVFVSDITNILQNLANAMQSILGLNSTDFAIVSGCDYTPGFSGPGSYLAGLCYMNGVFYSSLPMTEGLYLQPNPTPLFSKLFNDDSISRYTYTLYSAIPSNIQVGGMPVFSGNMNQYRLNLKFINTNLQASISALNNAIQAELYTYSQPGFSGAKTAYDFTISNTDPNGTHTLDLSAKIPNTAKFVLLHCVLATQHNSATIVFYKYNSSDTTYNVSLLYNFLNTTATLTFDIWVPVDNTGIVGYKGTNFITGDSISITVGGWL